MATPSQYQGGFSGGTQSGGGQQQAGGVSNVNYYTAALKDINNGLASYYDAISRKYALRSNALQMEFEGTMADLNARQAANDAEAIAANGRYQQLQVGLMAAQDVAAVETQTAASGGQVGFGSAAEQVASRQLAKQLDQRTVAINTSRDIAAARTQMVNQQNKASLSRVSAENARRSSRYIKRATAFHQGLFSS